MNRKLKSLIFVALTIFLLIAVSVFPMNAGIDTNNKTIVVTDK